jgi:transcription elongation factor GreA
MFDKTIDKLEAELMELNRRLKTDIPAELNFAVSLGDLSENAEYHAAKEKKRLTEGRVSVIKGRIRDLKNIDLSKVSKDGIGLGSKVTLEDLDTDEVVTYELVVADDVDVDKGKISIVAPIGRALMGKGVDDEVVINIPAGKKEYLVTALTTMHERTDL